MRLRPRGGHPVSSTQPIVVANDWTTLTVPELGSWEPTMSVSIVIPAHRPRHLPHVLAALAAQSYPSHMLEVVVVDDGSDPPIVLPVVRPENTKLVSTAAGWGPGAARVTGVEQSDGDVLHWLDADMVPCRDEIEAHLRWHHTIDYAVVLGDRIFVHEDALAHLSPRQLREAVATGGRPDQLSQGPRTRNEWVHRILAETAQLSTAGPRAMRVHVTASSSVTRDLYLASGGFPVDVRYGEDTILGYRLREAGAVFIPEPAAVSAHPGSSQVQREKDLVNRYAKPFITDLVPEFRGHRLMVPRSYAVPYVEVVIPVAPSSLEDVAAAVNAQLTSRVPDTVVTLLADWHGLPQGRRSVLAARSRELDLVRAAFDSEPRVRFLDGLPNRCDAAFRLLLPDATSFPVGKALARALRIMEDTPLGLLEVALGSGGVARLERVAATARARRTVPGTGPEDVYGRDVTAGTDLGFETASNAPRIPQVPGLVNWPPAVSE